MDGDARAKAAFRPSRQGPPPGKTTQPTQIYMTKQLLLTAVSAAILNASSSAGEAPGKNVAPPAPVYYGTGFYLGLDAGANVYQDFGGTRRFSLGGNDVSVEPRENVGFV